MLLALKKIIAKKSIINVNKNCTSNLPPNFKVTFVITILLMNFD